MKKLHYILFGLLFLGFMFPAIQQFTGIFKEIPLDGAYKEQSWRQFTADNWFSGNFQSAADKKSNSVIGFHTDFVRARNQIDYSLFDITHVVSVVKGKNGYLYRYEDYYVKGVTNQPLQYMIEQVKRLKTIQDSLKANGKFMLYVIAPDKQYYWKEFLPDNDVLNEKSMFTYKSYKQLLKEYNCDFIDMNESFIRMKGKTKHTLYAKGGFHWTWYGASLAYDSILTYIQNKTSFTIPEMKVTALKKEKKPWNPDVDIYRACNLFLPLGENTFTYPVIKTDSTLRKTTAVVCADSYFNAIAWSGMYEQTFSPQSTFWYYNREINDPHCKIVRKIENTNPKEILDQSQVYIIMISTMNLERFDCGFLKHFEVKN